MTKLDRVAPEIPVTNLAEALTYYTTAMAFDVVSQYSEGQYAVVQRDDVAIHLFEDGTRTRPVGIHIFTQGIDELHDELKAHGASITQSVERKPWGNRDFRVTDPSGNEIKFTEPIAE